MKNKYIKVKGTDAVRDTSTGAILFNKAPKNRKKLIEQMKKDRKENIELKSRIDRLETLVNQLLDK